MTPQARSAFRFPPRHATQVQPEQLVVLKLIVVSLPGAVGGDTRQGGICATASWQKTKPPKIRT